MKELKAGSPPPPQPRLESRFAQHISHTRRTLAALPHKIHQRLTRLNTYEDKLQQVLRETTIATTERFRTNYDALLQTTAEELKSTVFYVPDNPYLHNSEPVTVAIASGNSIKNEEMQRLLLPHKVSIHRVPEAEEEHTLNIVTDAQSKAYDAVHHIRQSTDETRRAIRQQPFLTIANDVLNAVPTIACDNTTGLSRVSFKRLGKPSNLRHEDGTLFTISEQLESIRQTFQDMTNTSKTNHWQHIPFLAEIATVIHNPQKTSEDALSTQKSAIFLTPEIVAHLATPEGFGEYLYRLGQLGVDIRKVAAGLEFRTIKTMMKEKGMHMYITSKLEKTADETPSQQGLDLGKACHIALGHADERLIAAYFESKKTA